MTKTCVRCKVDKARSEFNWRDRAKGWLKSECRTCQSGDYRAYSQANPSVARARKVRWRSANPDEGKRYYAANREKERARAAKKDRAKVRVQQRARYRKDPTKQREAARRWLAKNPNYNRDYAHKHYLANKALYRLKDKVRRVRKRANGVVAFTLEQLHQRLSVFGHRCAYCAGPFENLDHLKPISRGGMHCLANLRPSCERCNKRKYNKPPKVWLSQQHK